MQITSLEGYANDWLKACHSLGRSLFTIQGYSATAREFFRFLRETGTPQSLASITDEHLREYLSWLRERGVKHNTVVTREAHLRAFFKFLEEEGEIPDDPFRKVRRQKAEQPLMQPPSPEQMQAIIDAAVARYRKERHWRNLWDVALVAMLFDAGLRASELLSMRYGDISRDEIVNQGKGRKERMLMPSANVMTALRRYLRAFESAERPLTPEEPIWQGQQGPITYKRMHQIVQAAGKAAGVYLHPHLLDHGFATYFLEGSNDKWALQVLLGHASDSMTKRYTKTLEGHHALREHQATVRRAVSSSARPHSSSGGQSPEPGFARSGARMNRTVLLASISSL